MNIKIIITLLVLSCHLELFAQQQNGNNANAQQAAKKEQPKFNRKKTINDAKDQIKGQKYPQAEDILNKAMNQYKKETNTAEFHYLRMTIQNGLAVTENRNIFLKNRPDTAKYFSYIYRVYELGLSCDSLDHLPNAKGKVKPSYTSNIINYFATYRNNIKSAGKFFYKKKKYDEAWKYFDMYLSTRNSHLIKSYKYYQQETDSMDIARLAVYSAFNQSKYRDVRKYLPMVMKDSVDYVLLCQIGSKSCIELKDTLNALDYLYEGWKTDPSQEYFYMTLIDFYINNKNYPEALAIIDAQLFEMPDSRRLWYIKGKCHQFQDSLDIALKCYQNAIEIQSDDAASYSSIGMIYVEKARRMYIGNDYLVGTKEYTRTKQQITALYEVAQTNLEKARSIAPDDKNVWIDALSEVYYNLNKGKELKELETLSMAPTKQDDKAAGGNGQQNNRNNAGGNGQQNNRNNAAGNGQQKNPNNAGGNGQQKNQNNAAGNAQQNNRNSNNQGNNKK